MRILLDESLPRTLRGVLPGHDVKTVAEMGWASVQNGELLRRAVGQFDVLLTADQNIQFQQNLDALPVSVITLVARSNRIEELSPLMPAVLEVLQTLAPKSHRRIGA